MSSPQAPVRDLVLLSDKALGSIHAQLMNHWQAWATAWCGVPDASVADEAFDLDVRRVADVLEPLPDPSVWCTSGEAASLWRYAADASVQAFARQLVRRASGPFSGDGDWALGAARAALADLEVRWTGAVATAKPVASDAVPLANALHPALGGVLVSVPALGIHWLLAPALYRAWLPARDIKAQPLAAPVGGQLAEVLKPGALSLELGIGHVDIAVTDLLELRVGDVVRFPTRLDEALPVVVPKPDGQRDELMRGRLGHRDGRLAVQVVSSARSI